MAHQESWQFKRVFTNQYSRVTLTSKDDQLEFVSVIENMIRELFLCDELVCTSMAAKSSYSMKGEEIHSYGIIVESTNKFMTNIRYKFKNVCFNCYDAFSSLKELKDHKRQYHSY